MYIVDSLAFEKPEIFTYQNEMRHVAEKTIKTRCGYYVVIKCETTPKKINLLSNDVKQDI